MKWIRIGTKGHGRYFAVSAKGIGLFVRTENQSAYQQTKANFAARTPLELERKLRKSGAILPGENVTAVYWP